jgi:rhombotail lipoprotein
MRARRGIIVSILALFLLGGCASMDKGNKQRQVASVLSFLFPGSEQAPPASEGVAEIKVPFRIGVAFVPDTASAEFRLAESERLKLAGEVRDAFSRYPFVGNIQAIPSMYLEQGGGFANLDRIANMLQLDVIALVSYDQVQNAGASGWSFLYWTGIGAYVIEGDQYDVLTMVDTAVFDIRSRRLLMRAGGTSNTKGTATMVGFSESARAARRQSFETALQDMITKLHVEVKAFRERAPKDPTIHLITPPGYNPAAAVPPPQ